jgi:GNAT superfamily N-acetyltransferase
MTTTIRKADENDIPSIIKLGLEMRNEAPAYEMLDFDEDKIEELLRSDVMAKMGAIFISEKDGEVIGMFAGLVVPHYFGHQLMANDLCFFVSKEHRGGTTAVRLIKAFESWCWSVGADTLRFSVSTNVSPERTLKLFLKMGYEHGGYLVNKNIKQ